MMNRSITGEKVKTSRNTEQMLQWAFGVEFAELYIPGEPEFTPPSFGLEYVALQRAELGISQIDGGGRSYCHDDADTVAAIVGALPAWLGGLGMSFLICNHAKAMNRPNWMPGAVPRFVPRTWKASGHEGETAVAEIIQYKSRGRTVTRKVLFTPVTLAPTSAQIAKMRVAYGRWWQALDAIRVDLKGASFKAYTITDDMPPERPWGEG